MQTPSFQYKCRLETGGRHYRFRRRRLKRYNITQFWTYRSVTPRMQRSGLQPYFLWSRTFLGNEEIFPPSLFQFKQFYFSINSSGIPGQAPGSSDNTVAGYDN